MVVLVLGSMASAPTLPTATDGDRMLVGPMTEMVVLRQLSPPSSLRATPREVPAYSRAGVPGSMASAVTTMLASPVLEPFQLAAALSLRKTPPGFRALGVMGK